MYDIQTNIRILLGSRNTVVKPSKCVNEPHTENDMNSNVDLDQAMFVRNYEICVIVLS